MGTWSLSVPPHNPILGSSFALSSISFVIPLKAEPEAHVLEAEKGETAECPGTAAEPKAALGQLCIYVQTEGAGVKSLDMSIGSHAFGATITASGNEPGSVIFGSWAVTAAE